MRFAYRAQDRGDFGELVKCLARSMATQTPGIHTRVEEGRSLLERPKTSRVAFRTSDLPEVYHHFRGQRPRRLQVDTKIYSQVGFSRQGAPRKGHVPGRASLDHLFCGGNKASGSA